MRQFPLPPPSKRATYAIERIAHPVPFHLCAHDAPGGPVDIPLPQSPMVIGRSVLADHPLDHSTISDLHFMLTEPTDSYTEVHALGGSELWFEGQRQSKIEFLGLGASFRAGDCRFSLVHHADAAIEREALITDAFGSLDGSSPIMRSVYARFLRLGATSTRVLISGETGTGKERATQSLHALWSHQRKGRQLTADCSLSAPFLAQALFGVRAGTFNHKTRGIQGMLELAADGTLFLDNVDFLPLEIQSRLLRALEDRRVTRVGDDTPSATIDVRVIATTSIDLRLAVANGQFLEGLYRWLARDRVHLPMLSARDDDVVLLAQLILAQISKRRGFGLHFHPRALQAIREYPWPGNIRQLESRIARAAYRAKPGRKIDHSALGLSLCVSAPST